MIPLKYPVGEFIEPYLQGAWGGCGCMVPDFCLIYHSITGHEVLAVHAAKGSTKVCDWLPDTIRYQTLLNKILAAEKFVSEIGHIYFIWLQGESDAIKSVPREDYVRDLTVLKNSLNDNTRIEKFGIIRVGYYASTCCNMFGIDEEIMKAQKEAVNQDDDFVMLPRITEELSYPRI